MELHVVKIQQLRIFAMLYIVFTSNRWIKNVPESKFQFWFCRLSKDILKTLKIICIKDQGTHEVNIIKVSNTLLLNKFKICK